MKLADLLQQTRQLLAAHDTASPGLETRFLIGDLLDLTPTDLIDGRLSLSAEQLKLVHDAIARRLAGEPVSRILGYREFYGRKFFLSPATLDPRPDSETLIEAVLSRLRTASPRILDLGTGTGCLILTLLQEIPGSTGIGIDLSAEACLTARKNASFHRLESRVEIRHGDWCDSLEDESFDLIVSNPPYIPTSVVPILSPEVATHDPILALDGGEDGLASYKILLPTLKKFLASEGSAFFEIGQGQKEEIARLAAKSGATLSRVWNDLGGIERVLEIGYGDK